MPKVLVLGSGLVGAVLAADLAQTRGWRTAVADRSAAALARAKRLAPRSIETVEADLADPTEIRRLAERADLVVGALPSHLGLSALRAVVEAGRPCCDISFMAEDPRSLHRLAVRRGVPVVVDCGVAPGLSHILAALAARRLRKPQRIEICVGGLPRHRVWPYEYKAAFSPADVIEEYVRPARVVEGGEVVTKEALSEPELLHFPGVGTLEAFNTDGLRTLIESLQVPHMRERTLRYPGHIELMRVLRRTGLFGLDPVRVGESVIRPRDLLAELLFPHWTYEEMEEDLTAMQVVVEGTLDRRPARIVWTLLDHFDRAAGHSSMARTTAFPAAAVARMLASGEISRPGVHPPERLVEWPGVVESLLRQIKRRGVEPRVEVLIQR
jgi:saccharopine dehydrogenase-like NADP-dependent oxidoreductase